MRRLHFLKREWHAITVIVAALLFFFLTKREGHEWGDDFAQYIIHARNIATLQPYDSTRCIALPSIMPHYPPVFPLILSPFYRIAGLNVETMKLAVLLCYVALLIAAWLLYRQISRPSAFLLLLLCAFNPVLWEFKDAILSEFLLTALMLAFMILSVRSERGNPESAWSLMARAVVLVSICYTRVAGCAVIPAVLLHDVVKFHSVRRSTLLTVAPAVILLILTQFYLKSQHVYTQFIAGYGFHPGMLVNDLSATLNSFFLFFDNVYSTKLFFLGGFLLAVLALTGFVAQLRRFSILESITLCYMVMIIVWPFHNTRFLIPIFPLLLYYLAQGSAFISGLLTAKKIDIAAFALLTLVILAIYGLKYSRMQYGEIKNGISKPSFIELTGFIRNKLSSDDLMLCSKPRLISLFTQQMVSASPQVNPDAFLNEYVRPAEVRYVLVAKPWLEDNTSAVPAINAHPAAYRLIFSNDDFAVYETTAWVRK
jgi:hypothetical protein